MAIRSARNVEKQKKKNRRAAPRKKLTRPQGNTLAVRRRLKKMAGKVEDREVFIDTVLKTELDGSPLGKAVKLDAYGNPIYDVYIRKVVKRADGKFWNVPSTTYANVSQFWKYDPETYLKQPPYSRTFQGIKKT